jgi:crotonobetainyl-CoA:carnitine CoA-transferase CaiB-like acyl-CoA transferase
MSSINRKDAPGALAGLRVLDCSRVLGGPLAAQTLADHGADVIKIEPPQGDEARDMGPPFRNGTSAVFVNINRNKRAMALDFGSEAGRAVLLRLLQDADVLIENFKAGTMERWGIGYDTLAQRFPRLIHATLTGFGKDGPLGGNPGYDVMVQAWTGLVSINGARETGPLRMGTPIVDLTAGGNVVQGVLLALYERERSGRGQHVDVTLYDAGISLTHPHGANWLMSGQVPGPIGNDHPNLCPYSLYKTQGRTLFIAVGNDGQFVRMCDVVGHPEWSRDARFATNAARLEHKDEVRRLIEGAIEHRDGEALCNELLRAGVPAGLVQNIEQAFTHPHTAHREMLVQMTDLRGDVVRWSGVPVKLSRTRGTVRRPPPEFNQHVDEILREAEFSADEIAALRRDGVIGMARRRHGRE